MVLEERLDKSQMGSQIPGTANGNKLQPEILNGRSRNLDVAQNRWL